MVLVMPVSHDEDAPKSPLKKLLVWIPALAGLAMLAPMALNAYGEWSRAGDNAAAVKAHLLRAQGATEAGNFESATVALEAANALAPHDPAIQLEAMRVGVIRAAQRPKSVDDAALNGLEYALGVLGEASDAGPALAVSTRLVAQGQLEERRGDAVSALTNYEKAVAADAKDVFAHLAVARLHRRAGRRVEALASFEAAVKAAPGNVTAQNNLGVQYVDLGRVDDAVAAFNLAIKTDDNVASRMNLATTLAGVERLEEAVEHMQHAIQLAPTSAAAYRQLGQLLSAGGRHADAEAALVKSLNLSNDVSTGLSLGRLYQVQKRHERAVEVFTAILKAKPEAFEAAFLLGTSMQALGRNEAAVSAYQIYLQMAERVPGEADRVAEVRTLLTGAKPAATTPTPTAPDAP